MNCGPPAHECTDDPRFTPAIHYLRAAVFLRAVFATGVLAADFAAGAVLVAAFFAVPLRPRAGFGSAADGGAAVLSAACAGATLDDGAGEAATVATGES